MLNPNKEQQKSSTFMGTVQNKLKDIKNFSNCSAKEQMVAVTALGVIFGALLPVVAVVLPVTAAGAAVALTLFFAVKAVEYGYKGLKWSAEKTWEGAKYTAGKIKAGYEHSVDLLKRGTSTAANRLGDSFKSAAHSNDYSIESEFIQDLLKGKEIKEVVNNTIKIVKANDSSVPSKIKSEIKSAIDSKIGELGSADEESNLKEKGNLEKQRKIVDRLEKILTKSPLDTKELSLITEVFSQYQNEVKGVLDDYEQHPGNYPKPPTLYKRMSGSLSSLSSLGGKSPTKSEGDETKEPFSSNLEVLGNNATVDHTRFRRNSSSSSLYDGPPVLTPVTPPKVPESPTSSRDSGRDSPNSSDSSTPTGRQSLSMKDVKDGNPQAKLRRTNSPYKSEQPSTHMSGRKLTQVNQRSKEVLV